MPFEEPAHYTSNTPQKEQEHCVPTLHTDAGLLKHINCLRSKQVLANLNGALAQVALSRDLLGFPLSTIERNINTLRQKQRRSAILGGIWSEREGYIDHGQFASMRDNWASLRNI